MRALVVVALAACATEEPCELVPIAHESIIAGYASNESIALARDTTIVCTACDERIALDANLGELARGPAFVMPKSSGIASFDFVIAGDIAYVQHEDRSDEEFPFSFIAAYSVADRRELWTKQHRGAELMTAGPEGPYLYGGFNSGSSAEAYTSDGALRWRGRGFSTVHPDGTGRAYLLVEGFPARTLEYVDVDGRVLWTKTFADAEVTFDIVSPAATGIAIVGAYQGNLELGDWTLPGSTDFSQFIAVIDPSGATRWAKSFGTFPERIRHAALRGNDLILAADFDTNNLEAVVIWLGSNGAELHRRVIGGEGNQMITNLVAGEHVYVTVRSSPKASPDDPGNPPWLEVDGKRVDFGERYYLLALTL